MRLRNHSAALALACAAAGGATALAPRGAHGQSEPPRAVQVTPTQQDANAPRTPPDAPGRAPAPAPSPGAAPAPADEQRRAIELYRAHFGGQLTKAPYLGVSTSVVPAALRQHLGLAEGVGLVVDFVEPDSPAQAAGLKQYDIIKKFDDQILVNAQQLAVLVRSRKAGDEVKLSLIRGGKEQSLSAKLVEKEVKPLGDLGFFQDWTAPGGVQASELEVRKYMEDRRRHEAGGNQRRSAAHYQGADNNPGTRRTMSVWKDNDMMLEINTNSNAPGRRLVVTDKSGKVLHDINLDDRNERDKLPPNVAGKLRQMEGKLPPGGAAAPSGNRNSNRKSDASSNDNNNDKDDGEDKDEDETDDADDSEEVEVEIDRQRTSKGPIGPNDLLRIAVADIHGPGVATVKTTRVRDGRVRLPYVEPIQCQGLTAVELEKQIVSAYARAKIAPSVNVRVELIATSNKPETAKP